MVHGYKVRLQNTKQHIDVPFFLRPELKLSSCGSLRLFINSFEIAGFAKKCLIPYKPTFGENFKRGKVVDVNQSIKVVTLESGEKLAYDDLIIATGTGGPFPAKLPLDVNKEKAVQRYEDYVKLVSDFNFTDVLHGSRSVTR